MLSCTGTPHESLVPHSSGDGDTAFLMHQVIVLHGKIPHVNPSVCCRGYTELRAVGVDVVVAAEFVGVNGLVATGGEREPHPQKQLNASVPETPEYLRVATSTRARQAFHLVCRKLASRA